MSESSPKEMGFSSLIISDSHLFCSFVLSHPLYFSYIIFFFSPYMFKILSFLSPLFVTTTILLLALLTTLHGHNTSESLETQPSFLFSFCSSVLEPKFDVNDEGFTSLEEYKMVVEASAIIECASESESKEITFVDKFCSHESTVTEALIDVEIQFEDPVDLEKEEETEKCEKENKVKPKSGLVQPTTQESKVQKVDADGDGNDDLPKFSDFLGQEKKNEEEDVALRSLGSMRKDKEWRRTLACKLFEERHNADVGQCMDQLWETYETQTEMKQTDQEKKKEKKTKTKLMMMKTKSIEKKDQVVVEEEDEDGIDQQKLCCLQALKFSTGKMHLGIARPNLLKLSKAFKGFYNPTKHPKKA